VAQSPLDPKPGHRLRQSFRELDLRLPAQELPRLRPDHRAPGLAVRIGRIPHELSREARDLRDKLRQPADGDFRSRPQVEGLRGVIAFQGSDEVME
jgi:hypothetical protein